jgi:hypothetical protein
MCWYMSPAAARSQGIMKSIAWHCDVVDACLEAAVAAAIAGRPSIGKRYKKGGRDMPGSLYATRIAAN